MKRLILATILFASIAVHMHAQTEGNPFQRLGYHTPVYTLGKDKEFHDQKMVVEINSVLFNTKTNEVVGFVQEKDSLTELSPELQSMSIDPLCEKYYSISPYAYCFNNPVRFVDPTGMWIEYYDGTDTYRYMDGQWNQYQRQGENIGQFTPYTATEGSFLAGVLSGLNMLSQNSVGKGLLGFFANDDNNARLTPGKVSQADVFESESGTIELNKYFNGSNIPTENGNQTSPFWLDIGHELAHRQDVITHGANKASATWLTDSQNNNYTESEKYATHVENLMRANVGLPLRTHYGTQGSGSWEPSRILRTGTRISIYTKTLVVIGNKIYPGVPVMY